MAERLGGLRKIVSGETPASESDKKTERAAAESFEKTVPSRRPEEFRRTQPEMRRGGLREAFEAAYDADETVPPLVDAKDGVFLYALAKPDDPEETRFASDFRNHAAAYLESRLKREQLGSLREATLTAGGDVLESRSAMAEVTMQSALKEARQLVETEAYAEGERASVEIPPHIAGVVIDESVNAERIYGVALAREGQELPAAEWENRTPGRMYLDVLGGSYDAAVPQAEKAAFDVFLEAAVAARIAAPAGDIGKTLEHFAKDPRWATFSEATRGALAAEFTRLSRGIEDEQVGAFLHTYENRKPLIELTRNAGGLLAELTPAVLEAAEAGGMEAARRKLREALADKRYASLPPDARLSVAETLKQRFTAQFGEAGAAVENPVREEIDRLREPDLDPKDAAAIDRLIGPIRMGAEDPARLKEAALAIRRSPEFGRLSPAGKVVLLDRLERNGLVDPDAAKRLRSGKRLQIQSAGGAEIRMLVVRPSGETEDLTDELAGGRAETEDEVVPGARVRVGGYEARRKSVALNPGDVVIVSDAGRTGPQSKVSVADYGGAVREAYGHASPEEIRQALAESGFRGFVMKVPE